VLNHAGPRVFSKPELAFLNDFSDDKFANFSQYALAASAGGKRGGYGGSVALAHAFADHDGMQSIYKERFGEKLRKDKVDALVWKESQLTNNFIRENKVDLAPIFSANSKLRFLMPVRNPIDCAISNQKTGAGKYLTTAKSQTVEDLLEAILFEEAWVFRLKEMFPDRFLCFFEFDAHGTFFEELEAFLKLPSDKQWLQDAKSMYVIKQGYKPEANLASKMKAFLEANFADLPLVRSKYTQFLG
jgi:hypothetical protein